MIEAVEEFADDAKKALGKNGFMVLILVAVAFGLYNYFKKDTSSDEYVPATGYASYPDAGENSEVIIDSINQEIWASNADIIGAIDSVQSEIIQNMDEHFEETNGYIQEGLDTQQEILDKVSNGYDYSQGYQPTQTDTVSNSNSINYREYTGKIPSLRETSTNKPITNPKTSTNKINSNKASTKKTTTTKKADTYTYKTKSGLNTSTSIVDALKATGANSSMENRKKIAEANGIKNYTGTASQNVQMLNKLKNGTLKKA